MERPPGLSQANNANENLDPDENRETIRKWYSDASFEGRTSSEFKVLREHVRKAKTLDFVKYQNDDDYRRLIHENPLLQEFVDEETCITLWAIYDRRQEIGLSEEQFGKLLLIFGDQVRQKFRQQIETGEVVHEAFRQFTPEQIAQHQKELLGTLKDEIALQEQDIRHTPTKFDPFPEKREAQ